MGLAETSRRAATLHGAQEKWLLQLLLCNPCAPVNLRKCSGSVLWRFQTNLVRIRGSRRYGRLGRPVRHLNQGPCIWCTRQPLSHPTTLPRAQLLGSFPLSGSGCWQSASSVSSGSNRKLAYSRWTWLESCGPDWSWATANHSRAKVSQWIIVAYAKVGTSIVQGFHGEVYGSTI